ncbi:hypothetical protein [Candidatus Nitrosocosmicus franklandus]|uniref:Uncharacterized protein n=1 Tax=Candidatus Nitrosocosmicus franklandianus TaxID=1798806 RepID=A0A484I7W5_9ARCH|nr:hypothetical protein [Candidatus Nitrosocosmicus franklandus]VFJ12902.1 protein of unknown function [Candidatus Nitrosocosmicus franklandus]
MSTGTDVSQDQERFLKEGWEYVKQHTDLVDKLLAYFKGSDSRDISPEQDQEVRAIFEQIKNDAQQGSRDLTSENISSEDQERIAIAGLIAGAHTAYKIAKNPVVQSTAKKAWKAISSLF